MQIGALARVPMELTALVHISHTTESDIAGQFSPIGCALLVVSHTAEADAVVVAAAKSSTGGALVVVVVAQL